MQFPPNSIKISHFESQIETTITGMSISTTGQCKASASLLREVRFQLTKKLISDGPGLVDFAVGN